LPPAGGPAPVLKKHRRRVPVGGVGPCLACLPLGGRRRGGLPPLPVFVVPPWPCFLARPRNIGGRQTAPGHPAKPGGCPVWGVLVKLAGPLIGFRLSVSAQRKIGPRHSAPPNGNTAKGPGGPAEPGARWGPWAFLKPMGRAVLRAPIGGWVQSWVATKKEQKGRVARTAWPSRAGGPAPDLSGLLPAPVGLRPVPPTISPGPLPVRPNGSLRAFCPGSPPRRVGFKCPCFPAQAPPNDTLVAPPPPPAPVAPWRRGPVGPGGVGKKHKMPGKGESWKILF